MLNRKGSEENEMTITEFRATRRTVNEAEMYGVGYNVISEGTNSGYHYRVVIKSFKSREAAQRYADKQNMRDPLSFHFVEATERSVKGETK
jgi:hypothetical protein